MKVCFLHIGSEKTGTSSIQRYFGKNRSAFLECGYWYPDCLTGGPAVHRRLSDEALLNPIDPKGQLAVEFREEYRQAAAGGAHTAVISSEFFHSRYRRPKQLNHIKHFLHEYFDKVCVIYYCRRQDHLMTSMHSRAIRGGWASDDPGSVYEQKGHYYFDNFAICNLWSKVFRKENLVCRVFDRSKLHNGDVIDDITSIIGAPTDGVRRDVNESLSFICLNALLLFNRSGHKTDRTTRRRLVLTDERQQGARQPFMTKQDARNFLARFDESNAQFFATYIDPSMGTGFPGGFESFPDTITRPSSEDVRAFLHAADLDETVVGDILAEQA